MRRRREGGEAGKGEGGRREGGGEAERRQGGGGGGRKGIGRRKEWGNNCRTPDMHCLFDPLKNIEWYYYSCHFMEKTETQRS
jgi:hypothetical protein